MSVVFLIHIHIIDEIQPYTTLQNLYSLRKLVQKETRSRIIYHEVSFLIFLLREAIRIILVIFFCLNLNEKKQKKKKKKRFTFFFVLKSAPDCRVVGVLRVISSKW